MIRAYRLYTGSDGNSHVVRGSVSESKLVEAQSILFKRNAATFILRLAQRSYSSIRAHVVWCARIYHRGRRDIHDPSG